MKKSNLNTNLKVSPIDTVWYRLRNFEVTCGILVELWSNVFCMEHDKQCNKVLNSKKKCDCGFNLLDKQIQILTKLLKKK